MGKIIDKATAEKAGLNFLKSVKPQEKETAAKIVTETAVKTAERTLELIHQASSLTTFAVRSKTQTRAKLLTLKKGEEPCFYIFNSNDNGFVIVSADDGIVPILGYSAESNLDETNIPPNMEYYLEDLRLRIIQIRKNDEEGNKEEALELENLQIGKDVPAGMKDYFEAFRLRIIQIRKNKEKEKEETALEWENLKNDTTDTGNSPGKLNNSSSSGEPLIKTKWSQGSLYNKLCPPVDNERRCLTGSLATAMAQIMYYHGHPYVGTGQHTSTQAENGGIKPSANFGNTAYRWDLMPQQLDYSSTTAEIDTVAQLMRHCGISVNTKYSAYPGVSTASFSAAKDALKNYFQYDNNINEEGENRWIFGTIQDEDGKWRDLIKSEIDKQQPVLYCGSNNAGVEHAFICDGYKDTMLFHFNWGDGVYDNAYFYLAGSINGYGNNNRIMYKIKPIGNRHCIAVSWNYPSEELSRNPVIFPYGEVSVVHGYNRTFVMSDNNNYLFESVSVDGKYQQAMPYGNKKKVTLINVTSDKKLVAKFRCKYGFELNGITYFPLSPEYLDAEVTVPYPGSGPYYGDMTIPFLIFKWDIMYYVAGIGETAFARQKSLNSINIDAGIKYIANGAFSECTSLNRVNAARDYNIDIYGSAFYLCENLETFNGSHKIISVGPKAFYGCAKLKSIVIHNMKSIGSYAFFGCKGLTNITFPAGFNAAVGDNAFEGCSGMKSILSFRGTPPSCGANTFNGIAGSIPVYVPENCIQNYRNAQGWNHFNNYQSITTVINNIKYVILDSGSAAAAPNPNAGYTGKVSIPSYFRYGDVSYGDNSHIYYVNHIREKAFLNSSGITEVSFSVESVGDSAFKGCTGITKVSFSAGSIGDSAFEGCTGITQITSNTSVPPVCGRDVFKGLYRTVNGVQSLKHITLKVGMRYVEAYQAADVWKDFTIVELPIELPRPPELHISLELAIRWPIPILYKLYDIFIRPELVNILQVREKTALSAQDIHALTEHLNKAAEILPAGADYDAVAKALQDIQTIIRTAQIVDMPAVKVQYYVSKRADKNGEHEIHAFSCTRKPTKSDMIEIGEFDSLEKAMKAAGKHYKKVDGCYYCCREAHTM
ncbi:MAG: C10 family peptidase [Endomicrobia bacterium]|nr:C10 family peptidase [Endomicrobiia bacterium]